MSIILGWSLGAIPHKPLPNRFRDGCRPLSFELHRENLGKREQGKLGHWKISSWTRPSYFTKDINFSPHIGRGRRKEPEKLILSSCSCKCSLSSSSARSKIVSSAPLWLKPRRIFLFFIIFREKNAKSARETNQRGWELLRSLTEVTARKYSNASKNAPWRPLLYLANQFSHKHVTEQKILFFRII